MGTAAAPASVVLPASAPCWPSVRRQPALALAALACLAPATASAFAIVPGTFVAALGGVYTRLGDAVGPELVLHSATTAQSGVVGSLPAAQGTLRAGFGSVGFAMQSSGGVDREVDGGAMWADGWLVTGGTGAGVLRLSNTIHGSISGQAEAVFALYASSLPFDFATVVGAVGAANNAFWQITIPNATRVQFTGVATGCGSPGAFHECGHVPFQNTTGAFSTTLTSTVSFQYGQPIYLVALFAGGVSVNGGTASFLNSADFALSAPVGANATALFTVQTGGTLAVTDLLFV